MKLPAACPATILALNAFFLPALSFSTRAGAVEVDPNFELAIEGGLIHSIQCAPDRTVLLGGEFTSINGLPAHSIAKLLPDGKVDPTFSSVIHGPVYRIVQSGEGSIYAAGTFSPAGIAKLNPDGSAHSSFVPEANVDGRIVSLALTPTGSVLAAGNFRNFGSEQATFVCRLTGDGTPDPSFNSALMPNFALEAGVSALATTADGSLIVGGIFDTVNGYEKLARLNSDGSLDSGFATNHGNILYTKAIVPLADGKTLVGGLADADGHGFVRRLDEHGNHDPSFSEAAFNGPVNCFVLDRNGGIIVGGAFTSANGRSAQNLAHFSSNGQLDTNWNLMVNGPVTTIALQGNDEIVIAGNFQQVGDYPRAGIARLLLKSSLAFSGLSVKDTGHFVTTLKAEAGKTYVVETSADLQTWNLFTTNVATSDGLKIVDPNVTTKLRCFFRAKLAE